MPYNGSGIYYLPAPETPFKAGTVISSTDMNTVLDDIATALSACLTRDSQAAPTANLNMGGFRLINLGDPVNGQDGVTRSFLLTATVDRDMAGYRIKNVPTTPAAGTDAVNQDYVLGLSSNLPVQTGKAGEQLMSNGITASWTPQPALDLGAFENFGGF